MITLGGVPLLTPDPDGELCRYVERFLSLRESTLLIDPHAWSSDRRNSQAGHRTQVGIDSPGYPDPPPARLNELYWPTGASRWARGFFLCTGEKLVELRGIAWSGDADTSIVLRIGDDDAPPEDELAISVRLIAAYPIGEGLATERSEDLWLLVVSDDRYHWQNRSCESLVVTKTSTWAEVFTHLEGKLGITLEREEVTSPYLSPDPEELTRRYHNAASLLDAVAHTVGCRIVRLIDGAFKMLTWEQSVEQYTTNLETFTAKRVLGRVAYVGPVPEKVTATFRKYTEHRPYGNGTVYTYDKSPAAPVDDEESLVTIAGTRKVIISTCYANFTAGSGTPDNNTKLDDLADQLATDFYESAKHRYDITYAGAIDWVFTGYDDHVLWSFGAHDEGGLKAQTRVQSTPLNAGVEEMLHQDPDLEVISSPAWGFFAGNQAQGSYAVFNVCRWSGSTQVDTGLTIKVWDVLLNVGDSALTLHTRSLADWAADDNRWIGGAAHCTPEGNASLPAEV
jgi:hypothetical protein